MQRVAPKETLALFKVMNYEGNDRMTFSEVSSRRTFSMRQSGSNVFNGEEVALSLQTLWLLPKPSTALSEMDDVNEEEIDVSAQRDHIRKLLDVWHVSSSHKHLLGSVNCLSNNILKYWDTFNHDLSAALCLNSEKDEEELVDDVKEPPDTPITAVSTPQKSSLVESPSSSFKPPLLSQSSFSFSSLSNLLNRYHVTVSVTEYLSIKCNSDGAMIYGQAVGTLTVASKVSETAATKLSCNIHDSIVFSGTGARDFTTIVPVSSMQINEKIIRSSEANGLFFLTSQPGSCPETEALNYVCSITTTRPKPPLQLLSISTARVVTDCDGELNPSILSGGVVRVALSCTYRFINTCVDRDITDLIADIPLPQCESVTSCTTESVTRGKIISKYDTGKRVLFARIPKLNKASELVMKADIEVG